MRRHTSHIICCVAIALTVALVGDRARADVVFDDGTAHTFAGVDSGGLHVRDSPGGSPTSVEVLDGASLGSVSDVSGTSLLQVRSGATFADRLVAAGTARLEVTGGSFRVVDTTDDAHAEIDGGTFSCSGSGRCVGVFDTSTATIRGGNFDAAPVIAFEQSALTVLGGSFAAGIMADRGSVAVHGGVIGRLDATNATLTLTGSGYVVTPTGAGAPAFSGPGEIGEFSTGTLDGTLADGTPLVSVPYLVGNNGRIVLAPVPEPAAAWLLAAGLIIIAVRLRA